MATEEELIEKEECEEHHHHHHDHEEHCECGHEHEHHHHHHDDDEECECGHEHHHHHHDDDDDECECGHEHHHHHHEHGEDCDCEDCVSGVSINHHDAALAGSFAIETGKTKEELDALIPAAMLQLGELVDSHEGVIGHIKSAIIHDDDAVMYSLTLDEVSRVGDFEGLPHPEKVSFAAIVYGVETVELREALVKIKEQIA